MTEAQIIQTIGACILVVIFLVLCLCASQEYNIAKDRWDEQHPIETMYRKSKK